MYFEFLFRRAHSRSLVDRMYWSGVNLNSFTTCSNDVTVGTTGPIGSGLPQLGFPRRFAIRFQHLFSYNLPHYVPRLRGKTLGKYRNLHSKAVTRKRQAPGLASPPAHPQSGAGG